MPFGWYLNSRNQRPSPRTLCSSSLLDECLPKVSEELAQKAIGLGHIPKLTSMSSQRAWIAFLLQHSVPVPAASSAGLSAREASDVRERRRKKVCDR